jgi:hypothetical protein
MGKQSYTAQDFIAAIPGTGGIVSVIARKVGCDWHTADKWVRTKPTVKKAYDDECEAVLDMAEGVLMKGIKEGDTADAKWYLTRKGKQRGYAERQEITGAEGDRLKVNISWNEHDDS